MNLYLYDQKHEQVIAYIELSDYCNIEDLKNIIAFLDKHNITDRYKELVVADNYKIVDIGEGFSEIEFEGTI